MLRSPNASVSARPAPWPAFRLARLSLPLIIGSFVCVMLMCLLAAHAPNVQAAPPVRPLTAVITNTLRVLHTAATTHQMSVFANGRITDQFRNENGLDQINNNIYRTTIAVMFDQHVSPPNAVDVGSQGEFSPIGPISLYTSPDYHFYPQYTEDTNAVYASRVLSYEITQRTLATTANNCVIMELDIRNTSSVTALTGGKLLYMVDINVATQPIDDRGVYDPTRRLVYLKDEAGIRGTNLNGYAMGISLLEGSWRGYGILGDDNVRFPDPELGDARLRNELLTPTDAITDAPNDVAWIVANIPDLAPGGESSLAFGLCASFNADAGADAVADELLVSIDDMAESFNSEAELSASKTAAPPAGSPVVAGEPITYRIAISNTGYRTVESIVVTDALPTSTDLIAYSTTQGGITVSNRLVTASVGSLSPGDIVTITLVARPAITSTVGTIISNQAYITCNLLITDTIITNTNVVTHRVVALALTATKRADPWPSIGAGERLTYTIAISNGSQGTVSGLTVSDTLPANTQFVPGSIAVTPADAGIVGTSPPTLATGIAIPAGQSVTVTFAVTVSTPLAVGTVIANTAAVTRAVGMTPTTAIVTNTVRSADLAIGKRSNPVPAVPGMVLTYTLTVSNVGQTHVNGAGVSDSIPSAISGVSWTCMASTGSDCITPSGSGNISNTINLRSGGMVTYTVRGTLAASATATLVNTAEVMVPSGVTDLVTGNNVATDTNTPALQADLSIGKSDTPDPVHALETLAYTLTVSNAGPSTAAEITVTDELPAGTIFGSAGGSGWSCNRVGLTVICTTPSLAPAATSYITLVVTAPITGGTIANTASVGATTPDPDAGDNSATAQTTVNEEVALSTHKDSADATGSPLFPYDTLIYTVAVTNPDTLTSRTHVVITDSVPTFTTLVAGSVQSNGDEVSIVGNLITARRDTLGPGQVFTLTFRVTVDPGTGGATITNQAHVASDQQPDPSQPPPTADVVTIPAPGLTFSKWADPERGSDDSWTKYHFAVTNTGNMPLTRIQIWDDHLSPIIGPFIVPDLPAGGDYTVKRWWPMSMDVTNVATVTAYALGFPDPLWASDDAFFDVIYRPSLAFDVSVEPVSILAAQSVTYTYRLTNTSRDWLVGGTITDTQWGIITSGLELAPGAAYTQIATQWIAATTVNMARARGFNLLGVGATATDSATVTVGTPADLARKLYLPVVTKGY